MSEWEETTLGEILELITDYHANGSYKTLKENVDLLSAYSPEAETSSLLMILDNTSLA